MERAEADPFVKIEAVTPDELQWRGVDFKIMYGFHPTPFGEALIAVTERGICALIFAGGRDRSAVVAEMKSQWIGVEAREAPSVTGPYADRIFGVGRRESLTLHLKGTDFQLKVWRALLKIPAGSVASYEDIARMIGKPHAARAVANAVAQNPVGFLIPCHRVIRKSGLVGGYRWGVALKKAMLEWEASGSKLRRCNDIILKTAVNRTKPQRPQRKAKT